MVEHVIAPVATGASHGVGKATALAPVAAGRGMAITGRTERRRHLGRSSLTRPLTTPLAALICALAVLATGGCAVDEADEPSAHAACKALADLSVLALDSPTAAASLRAAANEAPEAVADDLARLVRAADELAGLDPTADTTQALAATIVTDPEVQSAQASVREWTLLECDPPE